MEQTAKKPQLTRLLANEQLARLEHLRLGASRLFTNRMRGEHLSGKGGSSTDFSDYRNYAEGDDTRFVDWNIFSRLHKPYLKLYHQEEEMHVVVLVDASSSMQFEGKFGLAQQLAAAFGVVGLFNNERVSIWAFNESDEKPSTSGAQRGRGSMLKLFRFVEDIKPGGNQPLDLGVDELLKHHRGRGVVVMLSDFLTFGDLRRSFNSLFSHGLEIFAVQILGPTELDPELTGDVRMVDCESDRTLDVSAAGDLVAMYHQYLEAHQRTLGVLARQRRGRFLAVNSQAGLSHVMFDEMRRKGWVI